MSRFPFCKQCTEQCDQKQERSIIFSISFAWNSEHWFLQSYVDYEDLTRDINTQTLWESGEYYPTSVHMVIQRLQQAVIDLKASITHKPVAAYLATIE